jgi:hypothetical protein
MAAAKKVTTQVSGLPQVPEGGKFVVRKAKTVEGEETPSSDSYEIVLKVGSENEYVYPFNGVDDGTLSSAAHSVMQVRRFNLRKDLFDNNAEVELEG